MDLVSCVLVSFRQTLAEPYSSSYFIFWFRTIQKYELMIGCTWWSLLRSFPRNMKIVSCWEHKFFPKNFYDVLRVHNAWCHSSVTGTTNNRAFKYFITYYLVLLVRFEKFVIFVILHPLNIVLTNKSLRMTLIRSATSLRHPFSTVTAKVWAISVTNCGDIVSEQLCSCSHCCCSASSAEMWDPSGSGQWEFRPCRHVWNLCNVSLSEGTPGHKILETEHWGATTGTQFLSNILHSCFVSPFVRWVHSGNKSEVVSI